MNDSGRHVRVAVVGAGRQGEAHALAYKDARWADLVLVCDADAERARSLAERYGCAWTTSLEEVAAAEIDAALRAAGLPAVVTDGARDAFATSCVVLTASGTATVEAMLRGVPMVVAYRTSWSTRWLAPLVWNVRWLAMPNILAGAEVVPELLQRAVTPERLSAAAGALLSDPAARARVRRRLLDLARTLGPPGAVGRAADEVLAASRHRAAR